MIYDIIIIGSGISGLNTAYKLLKEKKDLKILILEKNDYIGGRIKTERININNHDYQFEEGAGRFNEKHKLLINLLYELHLKKNIIEIGANIAFYPSTPYNKIFIHKSPFEYINKVIEYSKEDSEEELQKYNFIEYCKKVLKKDEIQFIVDSFGYYKQIKKMNTFNAIKLFNDGMNPNLKFFSLDCGLDMIIKNLAHKIEECNSEILLNHYVNKVDYLETEKIFHVFTNKKIYYSKICILAIPKPDLLKFNILKEYNNIINSIGVKSLCRIYSIFRKKDIWFKDIGKSTTNSDSRYIIPIDKKNGLIMISYSDSKFANYWYKLKKENEKLFLEKIKNNIYKAFHKKIKNPLYINAYYWKTGTGYWLKNKDSRELSKKIICPNKNIPLFICGENYSETQGWMEGALETSNIVVIKLKKYFLL